MAFLHLMATSNLPLPAGYPSPPPPLVCRICLCGEAELQRWDAHPKRVFWEGDVARRDSCSVCSCSIPGMYLLYFLALLPVTGEELSSCTGV